MINFQSLSTFKKGGAKNLIILLYYPPLKKVEPKN